MRLETSAKSPLRRQEATLIDILDRVLDKGLVITGDIKVSLADVELLTIRIRLMLCSVEKAEQVGLDWWNFDPHFSSGRGPLLRENAVLLEKVRRLERRVAKLAAPKTLRR
jgi:gas vesicle protein GvpA/GvpJ/GvpM family